ncbi:uncharacterized protein BJX67DRAFT_359563 [Aspergillus lucknowensis]|uniref:Secreted protein n=1 Tax=Aspergillus lucknowensis TaxID=176173 RepID=A0ABR4LNN2_9EURO
MAGRSRLVGFLAWGTSEQRPAAAGREGCSSSCSHRTARVGACIEIAAPSVTVTVTVHRPSLVLSSAVSMGRRKRQSRAGGSLGYRRSSCPSCPSRYRRTAPPPTRTVSWCCPLAVLLLPGARRCGPSCADLERINR